MKTALAKSKPVVLVVEDETDLREALAGRLAECGFSVKEAADGHEAFEFLAKRGIDAVVCDVRMPRCDGVSLLKRTRSALGAEIPFAFITADAGRDAQDLLLLRSQAVFPKPFDMNSIVHWLRASLREGETLREDGSTPIYVTLTAEGTSERFVGRVRSLDALEVTVSIEPRSVVVGAAVRLWGEEIVEGRVTMVSHNVTAQGRQVGLEVSLVFPKDAVRALRAIADQVEGARLAG